MWTTKKEISKQYGLPFWSPLLYCPNFITSRLRSCCCFVCRNQDHKAKDVGHDQSGAVGRKDGCQNEAQTSDGFDVCMLRKRHVYNCDVCCQKLGNGQIYKALDSLEMEVKGRKKRGTLFNLPLLPLGTRTWELHKASNLDEVSESKVTQHQLRLCRWCFKSPQSWRQIQSRFTCFWWTSPVYGNCVTLPVTWEPHMIWPTFCSWMFPFRCDCCCCSSNFIYIYQNKGPNK